MENIKYWILVFLINITSVLYAQEYTYPFQNPNLNIEQRVGNLLTLLSVEEKLEQLMPYSPAITRLGIPAFDWQTDRRETLEIYGGLTKFPRAIGLAATFDSTLVQRVASAMADENRAFFNRQKYNNQDSIYAGLLYHSSIVSLMGDPRWAHVQNTFGEDPYLITKLGLAFTKGLGGEHPVYLKNIRNAAYYPIHLDLQYLKFQSDVKLDPIDLWNSYLPAFETLMNNACVEGFVYSPFQINGESMQEHSFLVQKILKNNWQFPNPQIETFALDQFVVDTLLQAVEKGRMKESVLDEKLRRLFTIRFKLGLFDLDFMVPFNKISPKVLRSKTHQELAKEAALKSMVLVKNENRTLPLKKNLKSVYISPGVGEIIRSDLNWPDTKNQDLDLKSKTEENVVIVSLGYNWNAEAEFSPDKINIPQEQLEYLNVLRQRFKNGKLIVLLSGNAALSIPEVYKLADALIYTWYSSDGTPDALRDILFGDANPSGRLPVTIVEKLDDLPLANNFSLQGRTYRFMDKDPFFPFGFGLSYTSFRYSDIQISNRRYKDKPIRVSVELSNTGIYAGEEVVQLYIQFIDQKKRGAQFELRDFQRVWLEAGETKVIDFFIKDTTLEQYDKYGYKFIPFGNFKILIGGAAPFERSTALGASPWQEIIIRHNWK